MSGLGSLVEGAFCHLAVFVSSILPVYLLPLFFGVLLIHLLTYQKKKKLIVVVIVIIVFHASGK